MNLCCERKNWVSLWVQRLWQSRRLGRLIVENRDVGLSGRGNYGRNPSSITSVMSAWIVLPNRTSVNLSNSEWTKKRQLEIVVVCQPEILATHALWSCVHPWPILNLKVPSSTLFRALFYTFASLWHHKGSTSRTERYIVLLQPHTNK